MKKKDEKEKERREGEGILMVAKVLG